MDLRREQSNQNDLGVRFDRVPPCLHGRLHSPVCRDRLGEGALPILIKAVGGPAVLGVLKLWFSHVRVFGRLMKAIDRPVNKQPPAPSIKLFRVDSSLIL